MTTSLTGRTRARRALLLSTAALGAAAIAAPAASAAVTLDWSTANVANSAAPADTERTWLGYVTNPARFSAKGTASPIAPATGPTVTPTSPRGVDQAATWSLPAVSGSLNPIALSGSMEFQGGVRFVSPGPAPDSGHGFTITVENPRIVLDPVTRTGELYATGLRTPNGPDTPPVAYDRTEPVFAFRTIDWSFRADGSTSLTLTPEVAESLYVFPAPYIAGRGPERRPNTFGSFTINVPLNSGPKGDKGDPGAKGTDGRNGTNGTNGKNGTTKVVRVQTSTLSKAPFKGKAARKVRVTARNSSKTLATGTVRGRTLTVTLAADANRKKLKGLYTLRVVGGKATAKVRL